MRGEERVRREGGERRLHFARAGVRRREAVGAKQLPFPRVRSILRDQLCAIFGRWRRWPACYATFADSLACLAAARLAAMRSRSLARLAAALSGLRSR